jgi:hypothetical protein
VDSSAFSEQIAPQDPNAYWDTTCSCVKGSAFPVSPRIRIVPLYDPAVYAGGQQSGKSGPQLQVVNFVEFFIESVSGSGQVTGRMTPILGKIVGNGPPRDWRICTRAHAHTIRSG